MYEDADLYSQNHGMQDRDAKKLLSSFCPRMKWGQEELVMDIGCGSGDNTLFNILPAVPDSVRIVAVDILPKMIDFARFNRSHSRIEYKVANIEDWNSVFELERKVTKIFSVYCFNWLKNQITAFKNVHKLLREGGEAVIVTVLSSAFWDFYPELINNPKWNKYLKNASTGIAISHFCGYRSSYYEKLLQEIGFKVLTCEDEDRSFVYKDDAHCRESLFSRCGLSSYIPENLCELFKDNILEIAHKRLKRNNDGNLMMTYNSLTLHLQNP